MAIDLVQYARGYQEGWYSALVLDDQPYTIEPEKEKLTEANIDPDVQEQAYEFISVFVDWLEDFEGLDKARRMETQRVLVIDVNIPELPDVRPLAAVAKVEPPARPRDTLTANGTLAGLVLIETILRKSKRYRQFPIVVLSAHGIQGGENRLDRIKKKPGAPVFYLDKANSSGKDPNLFRDVVMELLSDQRLLIVERIANFWKLEIEQVCGVLGLRKNDASLVAKMFDRGEVFPSKDPDERVELTKTIYRELCGLLRDREAIIGWLNSTNKSLNGETPLNLMSSADFEKLAIVKHYVDFLCQS